MSIKTYTHQEAMEKSWPHGRILAEVMEAVAGTKKESKRLEALRLSLKKIREVIAATCDHPLNRLVIDEVVAETAWSVRCTTCDLILRTHVRN